MVTAKSSAGVVDLGGSQFPESDAVFETSERCSPCLKEWVTTIIAMVVMSIGLALIVWTFTDRADPTEVRRNLATVVVGLMGTILGYYFGRVPAEKNAEGTERSRRDAHQMADRSERRLFHLAAVSVDAARMAIADREKCEGRVASMQGAISGAISKLRNIGSPPQHIEGVIEDLEEALR
jgi:hypothetical protein